MNTNLEQIDVTFLEKDKIFHENIPNARMIMSLYPPKQSPWLWAPPVVRYL